MLFGWDRDGYCFGLDGRQHLFQVGEAWCIIRSANALGCGRVSIQDTNQSRFWQLAEYPGVVGAH
jgi:hypothetical protein